MAFNPNIQLGAPPLLWSDVNEVLVQINQNFDALAAGGGSGPIDFNTLDTNVSPTVDNAYTLGSSTNKWQNVYTSEWSTTPGSELNGLWAGTAQIKGISGVIDLPFGSTVDGELIKDPTRKFFKTVRVAGQDNIDADDVTGYLDFASGSGIALTTNAGTDTVTITNTGILSVTQGDGITATTVGGAVTVVNNGVRTASAGTPVSGRAAGAGISISGTNDITITNTGVLDVSAGFGISAAVDAPSGILSISVSTASVVTNSYRNFLVSGQSTLAANGVADNIAFAAGYGIVLTTSTLGTDTVTIALDQKHIDINGSIFGDDSLLLVDGVNSKIVGPVDTTSLRTSETLIALGSNAGATNQGTNAISIGALSGQTNQGIQSVAVGASSGNSGQGLQSVAVGNLAGATNQGQRAVAIGSLAGASGQGDYAVALGNFAGGANQPANSIVINASGLGLNGSAAGLFIDPIRSTATATGPMMYNAATKEILYNTGLEFAGTTISTTDSSSVKFDVPASFQADVLVEADIQLSNAETAIRGNTTIKLVPDSSLESAANIQLSITSDNTIEPRLTVDTPAGVDLMVGTGLAGIGISKINGRVNLSAGNNAFIVRENGSWWMTPLSAAPASPTVGMYIADGVSWDPASKAAGKPYPVFYDTTTYNALY